MWRCIRAPPWFERDLDTPRWPALFRDRSHWSRLGSAAGCPPSPRGTPPALPPNYLRAHGVERPSRGAVGAERSELALDGRERRETMPLTKCLRPKSRRNAVVRRSWHTWKRALSCRSMTTMPTIKRQRKTAAVGRD